MRIKLKALKKKPPRQHHITCINMLYSYSALQIKTTTDFVSFTFQNHIEKREKSMLKSDVGENTEKSLLQLRTDCYTIMLMKLKMFKEKKMERKKNRCKFI